jgi:lysophospholipase L1-like esterase
VEVSVRALLLSLLVACTGDAGERDSEPDDAGGTGADTDAADTDADPDGGDTDTDGGDTDTTTEPDLPDTDHCGSIADFGPVFTGFVERFGAQDDLAPPAPGGLVFTGSSSIRRWEGLARAYADHRPIQRGIGGAQVAEIALYADALVNRHDPRGVVVFAGTNDVAAGVSADDVVARFRCLRERVWTAHGQALPVFFIGITPTPSRWATWDTADAVNQAVAALAEDDPGLVYVDIPAAFLATGGPPSEDLFVADGLHLSASGYALWDSVLRAEIDAVLQPDPADETPADAPAPGDRILIDLGPSNSDDGEATPSPDYLGQHWNNWHDTEGGAASLPGEHLDGLATDTGQATGVSLVLTGGFLCNGRQNGGLLWPDADLLGDLAVGSATGDYFYSVADDMTGGLVLRGLDPGATYALGLFGTREHETTRATTYTVHGAATTSATLQTSGGGAGATGGQGNDDDLVRFEGLRPDPWGQLFLDVSLAGPDYAYIGLIELIAE